MIYESQRDAYLNFIFDEAYNQQMMAKYIEEAIEWTSSTIDRDRLLSIQEGVKENIKDKFDKLWNKIKEICRKIRDTISNFATSNQGFLEKNKDIITGKVLKYADTITMYPYTEGIKRIGSVKIEAFDYNRVKELNTEDFSGSVLKGYFKIGFLESDLDGLQDKFIDYFRGGQEKEYKPQEINMSNLYDYCINYKTKIVDVLEKDEKLIEDSKNKMITALSKVKIEESSSDLYSDLFTEEVPYSLFFERYMYFNEADPNNNNTNTNSNNTNTNNNTNNDPDKNKEKDSQEHTTDNTNKDPIHKASDQIKQGSINKDEIKHGTDEDLKNDNKTSEDIQAMDKKCTLWFNTANAILQAKSKVCKEIYDTYFNIIKKHVKSYVGQAKDDKEGDTANRNVTDYANGLNDKAKQALENQKGIDNVEIRYKNGNEEQKDMNNYVIKITKTDEQGNNQVICQDVSSVYQGSDANGTIVPKSVRVGKDGKTNLWKLYRTYTGQDGKNKTTFIYIDPKKSTCNDSDFIEGNKVGGGDNTQQQTNNQQQS